MDILENLKWRYATKKFNPDRKLTEEQLNYLLEAANLAPTSSGFQPFSIVVAQSREILDKLSEASTNKPQLNSASQLFVFASRTNMTETDVEAYIQRVVKIRKVAPESLDAFRVSKNRGFASQTSEKLANWAARQAYIALGFLLSAAALAKIDACPMEGLDSRKFDEILGLSEKGLTSVVMAAVGFRSEEDDYQHRTKVRKSLDELVLWY